MSCQWETEWITYHKIGTSMLKCILERTNSPETFIEKVLSYGQIKFQNFASILYPNVCQSNNDLNKKTCLAIRTTL